MAARVAFACCLLAVWAPTAANDDATVELNAGGTTSERRPQPVWVKQVNFLSEENKRLRAELAAVHATMEANSEATLAEKRRLLEAEVNAADARRALTEVEARKAGEQAVAAQAAARAAEIEAKTASQATAAARKALEDKRLAAEAEARSWLEKRGFAEANVVSVQAETEQIKIRMKMLEVEERVALARKSEAQLLRGATEANLSFVEAQALLTHEQRMLEEARARVATAEADRLRADVATRAAILHLQQEAHDNQTIAEVKRRAAVLQEEDRIARARDSARIDAEEARDVRLETLRRSTEEALAAARFQHEREVAINRTLAEVDGKIREARENEDVHARAAAARAAAERQMQLDSIAAVVMALRSGLRAVLRDHLHTLVTALIALIAGYFGAREAWTFARMQLLTWLNQPVLVRETSKPAGIAALLQTLLSLGTCGTTSSCYRQRAVPGEIAFQDVVLPAPLRDSVLRLTRATQNAHANHAPLRHAMFYGPPGTGKTMVAQRMAASCGLDFACMSGGDVAPLGAQAVTELNRLFEWAKTTPRGMILFIDEAEAFLGTRSRGTITEDMRNCLSALLHHTGEQSHAFMIILATNRPGDLDAAVTDRMDESLFFPHPDEAARVRLARLYFHKFISSRSQYAASASASTPIPAERTQAVQAASPSRCCTRHMAPLIAVDASITPEDLDMLAKDAVGFSGRQMAKLILALQAYAYAGVRTQDAPAAPNGSTVCLLKQDMRLVLAQERHKQEVQRDMHRFAAVPTTHGGGGMNGMTSCDTLPLSPHAAAFSDLTLRSAH